jgi:hypothetical protein
MAKLLGLWMKLRQYRSLADKDSANTAKNQASGPARPLCAQKKNGAGENIRRRYGNDKV